MIFFAYYAFKHCPNNQPIMLSEVTQYAHIEGPKISLSIHMKKKHLKVKKLKKLNLKAKAVSLQLLQCYVLDHMIQNYAPIMPA